MTGIVLQLTIDSEPIASALRSLAARGADLSPAMAEIAGHLEFRTRERFELEQAPGGAKWPQSIRARVEGGRTLTDTGRLLASITSRSNATSAEVGTNTLYAAVHQFGAKIVAKTAKALRFRVPGGGFRTVKSVKIPARPFIGLDDEDRSAIADIFSGYLTPEAQP